MVDWCTLGALAAACILPARTKASHDEHEGSAMTANSRVTRYTIMVYVAPQLGSVVLGIAISHKPAASSGSAMALEEAPKLPIDITEAF